MRPRAASSGGMTCDRGRKLTWQAWASENRPSALTEASPESRPLLRLWLAAPPAHPVHLPSAPGLRQWFPRGDSHLVCRFVTAKQLSLHPESHWHQCTLLELAVLCQNFLASWDDPQCPQGHDPEQGPRIASPQSSASKHFPNPRSARVL